jgi:hypothetical protein
VNSVHINSEIQKFGLPGAKVASTNAGGIALENLV